MHLQQLKNSRTDIMLWAYVPVPVVAVRVLAWAVNCERVNKSWRHVKA